MEEAEHEDAVVLDAILDDIAVASELHIEFSQIAGSDSPTQSESPKRPDSRLDSVGRTPSRLRTLAGKEIGQSHKIALDRARKNDPPLQAGRVPCPAREASKNSKASSMDMTSPPRSTS